MSDDKTTAEKEQNETDSPVFTDAEINQASALTQTVIAHCQSVTIGFDANGLGAKYQSDFVPALADFCVNLYRRLLDETADAKFRAKYTIHLEGQCDE